jgi:hypothetical protein
MRHRPKPISRRRTEISRLAILPQVERAEVKFLGAVNIRGSGRASDQRENRIWELLPNSEIRRLHREPSKSEHVSARFGYVPDLLPAEFSDPQSYFPSEGCNPSGEGTRNPTPGLIASRAPFIRISSSCKANVASAIFMLSRSWSRASSD